MKLKQPTKPNQTVFKGKYCDVLASTTFSHETSYDSKVKEHNRPFNMFPDFFVQAFKIVVDS